MTTIRALKIVSLFSSGVLTGAALGINVHSVPALHPSISAGSKERADYSLKARWQTLYDRGKATFPSLALMTSGLFSYLAYHTHEQAWWVSAALTISIAPFTMLVMKPNIAAIKNATDENISALVQKWTWLHAVRAGALTAGFGVALAQAIGK